MIDLSRRALLLGFGAILIVFRTTDWRGLIRQAQEDADRDEDGGEGGSSGGAGGADCDKAPSPGTA